MKALNITILIIAAVSVVFSSREATAQTAETSETVIARELGVECSAINYSEINTQPPGTIVENDYPYLMSIECLQDKDFLDNRGWNWELKNMNPEKATHYFLKGKGDGIYVQATYSNEGDLVESYLKIDNTRIPPAIRRFIHSEEYDGWTMVSNEKVVRDFDPYQTEYTVWLSNGKYQKELNFVDEGTRIAFLDY